MTKPFSRLCGIVAVLLIFVSARASYAQSQKSPPPPSQGQPQKPAAPAPPASASAQAPAPAAAKHTITVSFDYDFNRTPVCSTTPKTPCVQQFVVYDISAGVEPSRRTQLFVVPVPPNAKGAMRGITGTSPQLLFEPGKHEIAVSAQMPDKTESFPSKCAVWVKIP